MRQNSFLNFLRALPAGIVPAGARALWGAPAACEGFSGFVWARVGGCLQIGSSACLRIIPNQNKDSTVMTQGNFNSSTHRNREIFRPGRFKTALFRPRFAACNRLVRLR